MTMDTDISLSRREATLRSATTTCLAGIALVQAIDLPSLFVQGRQFGVLAMAAMVVCVGLGLALAAAPAGAKWLWHTVAGSALVVFAGWAVPRLFTIPGLDHHKGHWLGMPGAAAGALAAVCLVLTVVAAPPTRSAARGLATATAVLAAMGPCVGALLVAIGPGPRGGEAVLASVNHIHSHGTPESAIVYQPLPGGHGGHYVFRAVPTAHQTVLALALIVAAAFVFTYGAVGYLRRRSAPSPPATFSDLELPDLERGLA
jgi:hypothetical protein